MPAIAIHVFEDPPVELMQYAVTAISDIEIPSVGTRRRHSQVTIWQHLFARLDVNSGVIYDDAETPDLLTTYLIKPADVPTFPRRSGSKIADAIVTYNAGWRNHFHFLTQCAFATWQYNNVYGGGGTFVFPAEITLPRQHLLELCGANIERTEFHTKRSAVAMDSVKFTDTTYGQAYKPSSMLATFGGHIAGGLGVARRDSTGTGLKLYVSRRDSPNRALRNEAELEEALTNIGFSVVVLSQLSLSDQVACFVDADIIISPHGAGLSNIIFSRPGTRVVEICPESYINPCFLRISEVIGLFHHILVASNDRQEGRQQTLNWEVPIDRIVDVVLDILSRRI